MAITKGGREIAARQAAVTYPSERERVLRLKGGKVSTEHGIVVVQFRILPFEPFGLDLLVAELRLDEGLVAAALVQHGPDLPRFVPAVDQGGGWFGAVQNRGDAGGIGGGRREGRWWFGVFVVGGGFHHRGGARRLAGEAEYCRGKTVKRDWV